MKNRSDIELIARIQAGDDKSFEELYRRYERKCYYTAFSIMRNEHDAKDAVQATFLQVHKSIHSLQKPEFFLLWLNRITCGKCKDIFRKNKTISIDIDEEHVINEYEDRNLDGNPKKYARYQSDKELIDHLINELPYAQREVIVLCYFHNLTMQEIADVLDEAIGTIKSRLFLAKKNLRRRIEAYESREGIRLDFNSVNLEALLVNYFAIEFAKILPISLLGLNVSWLSKVKCSVITSAGKIALGSTIILTSGVVVSKVYETLEFSNDAPMAQSFVESNKATDNKTEMRTARQAYFTLLHWAANEEQIKRRSEDEAKAIKAVYEYLKKDGGPYWNYLKEKGWSSFFEQKLQYFEIN